MLKGRILVFGRAAEVDGLVVGWTFGEGWEAEIISGSARDQNGVRQLLGAVLPRVFPLGVDQRGFLTGALSMLQREVRSRQR